MTGQPPANERPKVAKVPTKLKRLAEERARVAGELEVSLKAVNMAEATCLRLQAEVRVADETFQIIHRQYQGIAQRLAALDEHINQVAPSVRPESIAPIRAIKGKFKTYGNLRTYLLEKLTECSPNYISTSELGRMAVDAFAFTFPNANLRNEWKDSVYGALRNLAIDGLIEKGAKIPCKGTGPSVTWRLKTFDELRLGDL